MGTGFLIDTNAVIDFLNYALPESGINLLRYVRPTISIIVYIELLSKQEGNSFEIEKINEFLNSAVVYEVNNAIAEETIKIRRNYKTKLPDAIIAATAINYNLTLVTRNVKDFFKIEGLELINPHDL